MTKSFRRVLARAAFAIAASVALVAGTANAAHAAYDPGYWPNNPEICQASKCVKPANLVRFWQSILWADSQGQETPVTFIDGGFGDKTHQATWRWQAYIGRTGENGRALSRDGQVGRNTWYAAWKHVNTGDPNTDGCEWEDGYYQCIYWGAVPGRAVLYMFDTDGGSWQFKNPRTDAWVRL